MNACSMEMQFVSQLDKSPKPKPNPVIQGLGYMFDGAD